MYIKVTHPKNNLKNNFQPFEVRVLYCDVNQHHRLGAGQGNQERTGQI